MKSKQISYPSEHELIAPITAFSTVHVNSFTIAPLLQGRNTPNDTRSPPGHLQRREIPKHLYYYFPPTQMLNH